MAEGGREGGSSHLSPLEEQYLREAEATDGDLEQELQRERELATHRLWLAFQDSATAVAHLFRDCQQQAGLAAWVPFHESASAVTQLYKGSADVCRQCTECGMKYGHRRRTKELIAWAKKKRRNIRREELLAFLLDKPYPDLTSSSSPSSAVSDNKLDDFSDLSISQARSSHSTTTAAAVSGLSCLQNPCYSSPLASPKGRRALFREELSSEGGEHFSVRLENGRKRPSTAGSTSVQFEFGSDVPMAKRMRL